MTAREHCQAMLDAAVADKLAAVKRECERLEAENERLRQGHGGHRLPAGPKMRRRRRVKV